MVANWIVSLSLGLPFCVYVSQVIMTCMSLVPSLLTEYSAQCLVHITQPTHTCWADSLQWSSASEMSIMLPCKQYGMSTLWQIWTSKTQFDEESNLIPHWFPNRQIDIIWFSELPLWLCVSHGYKKGKTAFLRQINRPDEHFIACRVPVKQNGKLLYKCFLIKNASGWNGYTHASKAGSPESLCTMKGESSK